MYRRQKYYERLIAWLLVVTLVFPFGVKAFHHHSEEPTYEAVNNHSKKILHTNDNCNICHFQTSSFTPQEYLSYNFIASEFSSVYLLHETDIPFRFINFNFLLRGPPAAIA